MPTLERLRPELIVTQALCDVCAEAESEVTAAACSPPGQPKVINLEPTCLEEVFQCMQLDGDAAGVPGQAFAAIASLRERVKQVEDRSRNIDLRPKVVLLEWIDPPFSFGHWSPELVRLAGGIEMLRGAGHRGPHQRGQASLIHNVTLLRGFESQRQSSGAIITHRRVGCLNH